MVNDVNKPDIKTTTVKEGNEFSTAKDGLIRLAETIKHPNMEHVGSISLHIYKNKWGPEADFMVVNLLTNVPETLAIQGAKIIQERMMETYGHKKPRKRGE